MTRIKPCPSDLGKAGRKFWRKVLQQFTLEDEHDLERLHVAATCLDFISKYRQVLEEEGQFFLDRYNQPKEHPAAEGIRKNQICYLRAIRELGLDLDTSDTRPPPRY